MKKTIAKTKAASIETLLDTLTTPFRKNDWYNNVSSMKNELGYILGKIADDDDSEAHAIYDDLSYLFTNVIHWRDIDETMKHKVRQWIGSLCWENFYDDEKKEYYSLGGMFWNKLEWISKNESGLEDDIAVEFADRCIETLPAFLDALEVWANEKARCKPTKK